MKKNILSMAALLMASATVFTGCSNDDVLNGTPVENPTEQQTYTMTIEASKGGDGATTRALSIDDSGAKNVLNATWATSEKVYVKKGSTWATGSLQPEADGATATLKGTLSGIEIAANDVLTLQFPKSGAISYAGQVGTLEDIAANFDYATATVKVASVSATGNINPEAATTTFENQQTIVKFTLVDKADGTTPLSATQLVVNDGTTDYAINPASATSVIYVAIPGISGKTVTLTATVDDKTYTYEKSGVSFTNGKYYEITVKMIPEGAISGKFTINGSGTQVYFSKGNLQATYNGSSWTWAFAANQWDYIGEAEGNGNTKVTDSFPFISENATVDLFGWVGASSDWAGVAQYGITSSTTTNSKDGYGNNASEALKSDWGTLMGSGWRTLTSAEWVYLFYSRTTEKGTAPTVNDVPSARYAKATVASKAGIILFPDSYIHPSDVTQPTNINTPKAAFSVNTYDATAWGKMESAGCVFLPAAGSRYGTAAYGAGTYCGYWSSSPRTSNVNYAYYVYLNSGSLNPADYDTRYRGYSVRLVRQVE